MMPYFKWTGITINGSLKRGKSPGYSSDELSMRLLKQGIALLYCKKALSAFFLRPVSPQVKSHTNNRIAQLLQAGIMLPDALILTAQQSTHPLLYDTLFVCAIDVQRGKPFFEALESKKKLYDSIALTMLRVGYESGDLTKAFENVARYYSVQHDFYKKVRAALAMPIVTFSFFAIITLFIFIVIMPRFADVFASLQNELPPLTVFMLSVSSFIRSWYMGLLVGALIIGGIIVKKWCNKSNGRCVDMVMKYVPFIGKLLYCHHLCQLFNGLSLLIMSGVSLSYALQTILASVTNKDIKQHFVFLYHEIQAGRLLSEAMIDSGLFLPEVIAVTRVGEESGSLGTALEYCALLYKDILHQMLVRFIFFLQPCLIILLGMLITALIFAVYLPVMEMSRLL